MTMEVSDLASVDVCVVGAGSAGSSAAIAAARGGASVLLIDRLPFLGGTSTAVLDTFYGFYTPGSTARKVVGGIGGRRRRRRCATLGPVVERPNTYGAGTGVTYLAEHLKVVWERLVTDAGRTCPAAHDPPGCGGPRRPGRVGHGRDAGRPRSHPGDASSSTRRATRTCARSPASGSRRPARSIRPRR